MEKLSQEYILSIVFSKSVSREEMLMKKYEYIEKDIKDKELVEMLKSHKNICQEHIKMLKDKMIKLNIQG